MVENLIASLKFGFGLEQCNGNVAMRTSSDQSVNHSLTAKKNKNNNNK